MPQTKLCSGQPTSVITNKTHHGIIIVIRRRTRAAERAALFRLLERAGDTGIQDNINFA